MSDEHMMLFRQPVRIISGGLYEIILTPEQSYVLNKRIFVFLYICLRREYVYDRCIKCI